MGKQRQVAPGQAWRAYLASAQCSETIGYYQYPANETLTDAVEERQMAYKRERESHVVHNMLGGTEGVTVDFGCGVGRHLRTLDAESEDTLVIGIDPDRARAASSSLNCPNATVVCADIGLIESAPPQCTIDRWLCVQVLGHVPREMTRRIVDATLNRLAPGGNAVFLVPFANAGASNGTEDLFHVVHLDQDPGSESFRTRVQPDEFDRLASGKAPNGELPVRAFRCDIEIGGKRGLKRISHEQVPQAFTTGIAKRPNLVLSAQLVGVHAWRGGRPWIGDIALRVSRPRTAAHGRAER